MSVWIFVILDLEFIKGWYNEPMHKSRSAFTLVEMLVVIGITTLLAAMAIGYSRVGQNADALSVETAKVAQVILQARELALATYTGGAGGAACAYGVQFHYGGGTTGDGTYSLFAYTPPKTASGHCPSLASSTAYGLGTNPTLAYEQVYAEGSWNMPVAQGVTLLPPASAGLAPGCDPTTMLGAILFYPPDPAVLVNYEESGNTSLVPPGSAVASVCLATTDGQNATVIKVNPYGQVSF